MIATIKDEFLVQVAAAVAATGIVGALVMIARAVRAKLRSSKDERVTESRAKGRARDDQFNETLYGAMGKANYSTILHSTPVAGGVFVEIEVPDGTMVWSITIDPATVARELALAARFHFGLTGQFYGLFNKRTQREMNAKASVSGQVMPGDRLALTPHGLARHHDVWGFTARRSLLNRVRLLVGKRPK